MDEDDSKLANFIKALCTRGYVLRSRLLSGNRVRIMGRVDDKMMLSSWLPSVRNLHLASIRSDWPVDISKLYFVHGDDDELVCSWRIILEDGALDHLEELTEAVINAPRGTATVETQKLYGAGMHRLALRQGKGAQGVLNAMVGPAAAAAAKRGGI
jgi:hypothetical protein